MADTFEFFGKFPGSPPQFFIRGYDESGPGIVHFEHNIPSQGVGVPHTPDDLETPAALITWNTGDAGTELAVMVTPDPFDLF